MIIWGIKSKQFNGEKIHDIECPSCRKRDFYSFGNLKFIHVFWIPMFVISKKIILQCSNCSTIITKKELNVDYYKALKKGILNPSRTIPRNFGILLFGSTALIFISMVISSF